MDEHFCQQMKRIAGFAVVVMMGIALGASARLSHAYCVTQAEAEKVLGKPVQLKEKADENRGNTRRYTCTYSLKDDTTSNLYYVLEEFADDAAARNDFKNVIDSNAGMPGQQLVHDIGDETFIHSDAKNFCLIMARKGNKIVRVKVNRLTSTTSLPALKAVVNNIIRLL